MTNKTKIFLDFDNTIVNSTEAFCKVYNLFYNFLPNYRYAEWDLVNKWDFSDQCTLIKSNFEIERLFEYATFFSNLNFYNKNTYKVLEKLNNKYKVIIFSIGTLRNIHHKSYWIEKNLPFIENFIFLNKEQEKSSINMKNGIFIDDNANNLRSNNTADIKICFGKKANWNNNWDGLWCPDWSAIEEKLIIKI